MDTTSTEIDIDVEITPAGTTSTNMGCDQNTMKQMHIPVRSLSPPPNLPPGYLLDDNSYFKICVPLYEASITGDWKAATDIFDLQPELAGYAITKNYDTVLHVASSTQETMLTLRFVKNLIEMMGVEDLERQNNDSNTALCLACAAGNIKMAEIMVTQRSLLLSIPGRDGLMPLHISALHGRHKIAKYLYDAAQMVSSRGWTYETRSRVLSGSVKCDLFDVALRIVKDHPELAVNGKVLRALARKPNAFIGQEQSLLSKVKNSIFRFTNMKVQDAENDTDAMKLLKHIWKFTLKTSSTHQVDDLLSGLPHQTLSTITIIEMQKYSFRTLFDAAEMGNTRFVVELLRAYPDLILKKNIDNHTIVHIATMHRHQGIYNLLYELGSRMDLITTAKDEDGNNMLHLVGKTSVKMRSKTSGSSLLMQRELLWFKEVEKMLPPRMRNKKNKTGHTPHELFSEENKDLVTRGLDWMKDCMVVATLIVTVAFAVAFTVPGAYDQNSGFPIFIHDRSFLVFVIVDAISLFSSSTSLLVFLSILTSRHGQRDFIYSLPTKLMLGLTTLFISVAAMMVTFSASFFVLYHKGLKWVPILIAIFSATPVILFAVLQFPLLVDMFRSMYDSRYIFKPVKRVPKA